MDSKTQDENHAHHSSSGSNRNSAPNWLPYVLAGVLLLGLLYMIYRNWQLNKQWDDERKAMAQQVRTGQVENDRHTLTLMLKSLAWAMQNVMTRNPSSTYNQSDINQYFNSLIQEKGVRELLLVGPNGSVILSTNKKNQNVPVTDRYPATLIQQPDAYFQNAGDTYRLSVPIMSLDNRLGTVIMIYKPVNLMPQNQP
ncbi:hypothetical protein GCM10023187_14040 [Nibrella viscosa]|uniref:GAF domain-containing protein n=1 Tax=Nibrella viscosa TaxID=1084524 RepID=A0ABP8K5H0_9BACT